MNMMRYEPWSLFSQLQNDINRLFDESGQPAESSSATADWVPAVDIHEYPERFVLYADVPGIAPEAIDITLENGVLSLSGDREQIVPDASDGDVRRRVERARGRFHRRFTLPDTVDADAVEARGSHGVLEITIPKRAATQPRKITVQH